ncbi:heme NO-binding domain-containing protein [Erythrobacter sp. Alg231-14]|uniref:heme NO-binding domain-containing protein n=1 Tax=Erythrobacter sp. Alg231-14 TaxID=1922225 RepID=UPI000D552143
MKGIIYAELVGFLDHKGGPSFTEEVLAGAELPHGGAFSRVSQYPWEQAVQVVTSASRISGADANDLCQEFGRFLFGRFTVLYTEIVNRYPTAETMLEHVEDHIHQEVKVLYPDAAPPTVTTRKDGDDLVVEYQSHRPFAFIAAGLVQGCMSHFGDSRTMEWVNPDPTGKTAHFRIN